MNYADDIYPTIKEDNILDVYELSKQNILDNNLSPLFFLMKNSIWFIHLEVDVLNMKLKFI